MAACNGKVILLLHLSRLVVKSNGRIDVGWRNNYRSRSRLSHQLTYTCLILDNTRTTSIKSPHILTTPHKSLHSRDQARKIFKHIEKTSLQMHRIQAQYLASLPTLQIPKILQVM
jgi:hypothetical protein